MPGALKRAMLGAMAFGRNPHVPRAQAAEQKAEETSDDLSWSRACHEAAHEWERAARREKPGKLRDEYERNATRARERASLPRSERTAADEDPEEPDAPRDEDHADEPPAAPQGEPHERESRAPADAPDEGDADKADGVVIGLFSRTRRRSEE